MMTYSHCIVAFGFATYSLPVDLTSSVNFEMWYSHSQEVSKMSCGSYESFQLRRDMRLDWL